MVSYWWFHRTSATHEAHFRSVSLKKKRVGQKKRNKSCNDYKIPNKTVDRNSINCKRKTIDNNKTARKILFLDESTNKTSQENPLVTQELAA